MVQYYADDPTYFVLDTGEVEPPRIVLRQGEDGRVNEILFDRLIHMYRDDSLKQ